MRSYSVSFMKVLCCLSLAVFAGCFSSGAKAPTVNAPCKTNDSCPSGYQCLPGTTGVSGSFCCKDATSCGPTGTGGAGGGKIDGAVGVDGPSSKGGAIDSGASGGIGGGSAGAGGAGGIDGGASGGAGGNNVDAPIATGGTSTGGATGSDGPSTETPADVSTPDAPGTCSTDKDCPTATPLCLNGQCGKCAKDSDCVGRSGPACASSGLCVACTANSYCKGAAASCDTATNQCVGCTKRADCSGACQTCSGSVCVAVKNQDDPTGCAGTCDATGACKSKQGQTCKSATDCVNGLPCADGYCCDKACNGSCEACDVSGSLGTCTTLGANVAPHAGHTACVATDATCAGKCNGTSSACFYTTASCGAATCSGATYTPAGNCSNGACVAGTSQSCPTNQTCSGAACACNSPNQMCSGSCTNTNTDSANCGSCGHSCGSGGTCSGGQCQPIVMATNLGGYSFVFGVDGSYVYYNNCSGSYDCTPLRLSLGAVGGTGTPLTSLTTSGIGVIGNTLLLFQNQAPSFLCTIGSTCVANSSTWLGSGSLAGFKSPSPSFFALTDYSNSSTETTTWYTTGNAIQSAFSWSHSGSLGSFAAVGNAVYFYEADASGTSYSIRGTVGFPASTTMQMAGGIAFTPIIVDANTKSLIYESASTNYLYRVPLPGGLGTAAPQNIVGANGTKFVTEDANGIYWIDSTGNVNRCVAPACTGNTVIATGQILGNYFTANAVLGALYQDASYLYWVNGLGQLVKLVK